MLVLVSKRLAQAGAVLLALALVADLAAHVAGWVWAESPTHAAVFAAMVTVFSGVLLRGIELSAQRKERVHASR